jgi:hypothetical protein
MTAARAIHIFFYSFLFESVHILYWRRQPSNFWARCGYKNNAALYLACNRRTKIGPYNTTFSCARTARTLHSKSGTWFYTAH